MPKFPAPIRCSLAVSHGLFPLLVSSQVGSRAGHNFACANEAAARGPHQVMFDQETIAPDILRIA
jgi:hypothetical protein